MPLGLTHAGKVLSGNAYQVRSITMTNDGPHAGMANAIRALSIDGVEAAKSSHPGLPMGCAQVVATLFTRFLAFDASAPHWPDRDRFILSAGQSTAG